MATSAERQEPEALQVTGGGRRAGMESWRAAEWASASRARGAEYHSLSLIYEYLNRSMMHLPDHVTIESHCRSAGMGGAQGRAAGASHAGAVRRGAG